jgi:threonine 3-dehydrogenase
MKTMKALVKAERGPGLRLSDVPVPSLRASDVLIRIHRTAICGTDLHIYNWDEWAQRTIPVPMHVGHEFVGRIEATGEDAGEFRPGELVSGEGHIVCGHCRNCRAGQRHLCINTLGVGVNRPGAFAEYLALPMTNVWRCDPDASLDVLACFDPLGNAVHSALSFDLLGEDVLITGAGPIGCMSAAVARFAGARHIVVTDVIPYRLDLARKMGATLAVDPRSEDLGEVQKRLGMREGFDVGLEMSGTPDGLRGILDNVRNGANIALLGILSKEAAIDWASMVFKGLTIKGIYGRRMFETWHKMNVMVRMGLDICPVITHRFHYTDFEKGFAAMRSGHAGKVVLTWVEES